MRLLQESSWQTRREGEAWLCLHSTCMSLLDQICGARSLHGLQAGWSPLMLAAMAGHADVVGALAGTIENLNEAESKARPAISFTPCLPSLGRGCQLGLERRCHKQLPLHVLATCAIIEASAVAFVSRTAS